MMLGGALQQARLFIAVTYYWLPAAHSLGAIYLAYAALGVGYAMTALVPATTLVARWFVRRRALAIALTQSGLSLGGILLTPMLARALEIDGMDGLRAPWALAVILLNVPLALLLLRPNPQAMGLNPDGDADDPQGKMRRSKAWRRRKPYAASFSYFLQRRLSSP